MKNYLDCHKEFIVRRQKDLGVWDIQEFDNITEARIYSEKVNGQLYRKNEDKTGWQRI